MESEGNFSPVSSYLFPAPLRPAEWYQKGGEPDLDLSGFGLVRENAAGRRSDREMEPTGTRVRHRRSSEVLAAVHHTQAKGRNDKFRSR